MAQMTSVQISAPWMGVHRTQTPCRRRAELGQTEVAEKCRARPRFHDEFQQRYAAVS
jgi:hypothetical protein